MPVPDEEGWRAGPAMEPLLAEAGRTVLPPLPPAGPVEEGVADDAWSEEEEEEEEEGK